MAKNWFSWITIFLCFAAAIQCIVTNQYLTGLVFMVAVYNIGVWLWLDLFKGVK